MIVTGHFAYLHLHKSAGSFVNEALLRFIPGARQIGYHLPRSALPPDCAHLPVLGFVRNPWSYYVSWYNFQRRLPQQNALYRLLSEEGRLDFSATLANMQSLGSGGALLQPLLEALPTQYTNRGLNVPRAAMARIEQSGRGFYSFLYHHIYDGAGIRYVSRMEQLRTELPRMLMAVGEPVGTVLRSYIEDAPARNAAESSAYVEWYTPETRALVAERDADLISEFGYRFGE